MKITENFCPVTGERIIGLRLVNLLPRWRPLKNHVQFDVLLTNNDTMTFALSKNGFEACRTRPTLVDTLWSLTRLWWLDHGFPSGQKYAAVSIKEIQWASVIQGLRVR